MGNSNLKHVTQRVLTRQAFRGGWEARILRGRGMLDIVGVLREEDLGQFQGVVVFVGGNDVGGRCGGEEGVAEGLEKIRWGIEQVRELCEGAGVKWVLVNLPPRRDIVMGVRERVREMVYECAGGERVVEPCEEGREGDFLKGLDGMGIHFNEGVMMGIVNEVVKILGGAEVRGEPPFTMGEVRGMLGIRDGCWGCGAGRHGGADECAVRRGAACDRCGDLGHTEGACHFNFMMCAMCGRWGHKSGSRLCPQWRPGNGGWGRQGR